MQTETNPFNEVSTLQQIVLKTTLEQNAGLRTKVDFHTPNTQLPKNFLESFMRWLRKIDSIPIEEKNEFIPSLSPERQLSVHIAAEAFLGRLTGTAELIHQVRDELLQMTMLQDTSRPQQGKRVVDIFRVDPEQTSELLLQKPSILDKYIKSRVRMYILLLAITQLPPEQAQEYTDVRQNLTHWLEVVDEILPHISQDASLQDKIAMELNRQLKNNEEITRLQKLLTGERLPTAALDKRPQLQQRVKSILLGNTAESKKDEVYTDLSEELINTAIVINEVKILHRLQEEGIDFPRIRERINELLHPAELQSTEDIEQRNQEIERILIPIANTVADLFPHTTADSPSSLSATLYRWEANCAGKVLILQRAFASLGLTTSSRSVENTIQQGAQHSIVSITLLGQGNELIIDANYPSYAQKDQNEIGKKFHDVVVNKDKRLQQNGRYVNPDARVLVYSATEIAEETYRNAVNVSGSGVYTVTDHSGDVHFFQSTIPYPHSKLSQGKASVLSTEIYSNLAEAIRGEGSSPEITPEMKTAVKQHFYYVQRALAINPNSHTLHMVIADNMSNSQYQMALEITAKEGCAMAFKSFQDAVRIRPDMTEAHIKFAEFLTNFLMGNNLPISGQEAAEMAQQEYLRALDIKDDPNRILYLVKYAIFCDRYSLPPDYVCSIYIEAYNELKAHPEKPHTYTLEHLAIIIDGLGGKVST